MSFNRLLFFFYLLVFIWTPSMARAEFCCERDSIFLPVQMPPEQERDCTGMLASDQYSALREGSFFKCPIKWAQDSYDGKQFLHWFVDEIGKTQSVPRDPEYKRITDNHLDMNYVWKAHLTLHKVNREVEGWTEEGYEPGSTYYHTGYVEGDWTLDLKLVNIHFNEVVEQGSIGFSGTCSDHGGEAMKDLVRAYFNPIHDTVYRYEQVPVEATLEFEQEPLEAGAETIVTVNLYDDWGRAPKPWQRVMVKIKEGDILNGVKCREDDKAWAFKSGNGKLQIKYKPPEDCEDKTETFTIYNSCTWGQEFVIPMHEIDEREVIGERDVQIRDLQPSSCTIDLEKEKLNANENMTIRLTDFVEPNGLTLRPEEKIMVKLDEGKILNGKKHGEYTIFPIGDGTVNVAYEAPDKCGLDKDKLTVHNVCEDKERGTLKPDDKIAEKTIQIKKVACDVSVFIKASFQWKDDSKNNNVHGLATMTVQGSMKFDERFQNPMVKRYTPQNMTVDWNFKETLKNLEPGEGCPELNQEIMGGSSTAIPEPQFKGNAFLELRKFGEIFTNQSLPIEIPIPPEAREQMTDQFIIVLPAAKQKIRGKRQKSSVCGEDRCPCQEYKDVEREIGVGSIVITGKIKPDGSLTGEHYWVGQGSSMRTLGFQVNEIGKQPKFQPPILKKIEDKLINVSVSWDIKVNK